MLLPDAASVAPLFSIHHNEHLITAQHSNSNMASSNFHTTQYDAENSVESVGAIAIKQSTREICLIRHAKRGE